MAEGTTKAGSEGMLTLILTHGNERALLTSELSQAQNCDVQDRMEEKTVVFSR